LLKGIHYTKQKGAGITMLKIKTLVNFNVIVVVSAVGN